AERQAAAVAERIRWDRQLERPKGLLGGTRPQETDLADAYYVDRDAVDDVPGIAGQVFGTGQASSRQVNPTAAWLTGRAVSEPDTEAEPRQSGAGTSTTSPRAEELRRRYRPGVPDAIEFLEAGGGAPYGRDSLELGEDPVVIAAEPTADASVPGEDGSAVLDEFDMDDTARAELGLLLEAEGAAPEVREPVEGGDGLTIPAPPRIEALTVQEAIPSPLPPDPQPQISVDDRTGDPRWAARAQVSPVRRFTSALSAPRPQPSTLDKNAPLVQQLDNLILQTLTPQDDGTVPELPVHKIHNGLYGDQQPDEYGYSYLLGLLQATGLPHEQPRPHLTPGNAHLMGRFIKAALVALRAQQTVLEPAPLLDELLTEAILDRPRLNAQAGGWLHGMALSYASSGLAQDLADATRHLAGLINDADQAVDAIAARLLASPSPTDFQVTVINSWLAQASSTPTHIPDPPASSITGEPSPAGRDRSAPPHSTNALRHTKRPSEEWGLNTDIAANPKRLRLFDDLDGGHDTSGPEAPLITTALHEEARYPAGLGTEHGPTSTAEGYNVEHAGHSGAQPPSVADRLSARLEELTVPDLPDVLPRELDGYGLDYFGLTTPPPPPDFLAGHRHADLPVDKYASFLERLSLTRPRPTATDLHPGNLPSRPILTGPLPTHDGQPLVIPHDKKAPTDHIQMALIRHAIWVGEPLGTQGAQGSFRQRTAAIADEYHRRGLATVLWTDITREEAEAALGPLKPNDRRHHRLTAIRSVLRWAEQHHISLVAMAEVYNALHPLPDPHAYWSTYAQQSGPGFASHSDVFRVAIMYDWGGFYADGDNTTTGDLIEDLQNTLNSAIGYTTHLMVGFEILPPIEVNDFFIGPAGHYLGKYYRDYVSTRFKLPQKTVSVVNYSGERAYPGTGRRNSLIERGSVTAKESVIDTRNLYRSRHITTGQDHSWATSTTRSRQPSPDQARRNPPPMSWVETVRTTQYAIHTLVRGLNTRYGDLHVTRVMDMVAKTPDPHAVWTAIARYLTRRAELREQIRSITAHRLEEDNTLTTADLPPEFLQHFQITDSAHFASDWILGEYVVPVTAHQHPVPPPNAYNPHDDSTTPWRDPFEDDFDI
ncbi:hypothetical protein ACFUMI_37610, partial [Streptomyces sp. NPDC057273]